MTLKGILRGTLKALRLYDFALEAQRSLLAHAPSDSSRVRKMTRFYSQFVRPGGLCFDVGANLGNRTEIFLRLGARVVALEPQGKCVRQLRRLKGGRKGLTVLQTAVGERVGEAALLVCDAHTLSTLSRDWVDSVRRSGRFSEFEWSDPVRVPVTTLDLLVERFGVPDFCKIDVEGFEYEVVRGLSRPLRALSLEFTPEYLDSSLKALSHLDSLGEAEFNYSLGESMRLALGEWIDRRTLCARLDSLRGERVFGDLYARFVPS